MSLSFFCVSLFRLVLVWYWHWWQGLWKFYSIKDFNIITFLKEKKLLYHDIYRYRDIKLVISWYKILVISPTPNCECCVYPGNVSLNIKQFECILLWSSLSNGFIMALMWPTNQLLLYSFYLQGVFKRYLLMHVCVLLLMECLWMFMHLF